MLKLCIFLVLALLAFGDDYSFYDVPEECSKTSEIKYYYDKSKNLCYSARPSCGQNGDGNKLYSSVKECMLKEMSPNRIRTVTVFCGDVGTPLIVDQGNGEKGTYLFPADCDIYGKALCPFNTVCFVGAHGYCCDPSSRTPNMQKFTFTSIPS